MNYLITMAHGADCFRQEAVYALLSARLRSTVPATALVVTDQPEFFARYLGDGADLRCLAVDRARLDAWRGGPQGYLHRIKPQAIAHAARSVGPQPGDNFLFVDSDTFFLTDPAPLFERLAAGEVLLNEPEGGLYAIRRQTRSHARLCKAARRHAFDVGGEAVRLPMDLTLWNSGVIGLCARLLPVLDDTIALIDAMWPVVPIPTVEQVALSAVLARRGIRPAATTHAILHYHNFKEFRADLALFFARHDGLPPGAWVALLHEVDPAVRIQPKLAFNRLPKWWRQLRKAVGRPWRPLPYPWAS
ncbi:hypothetical protein [Xylophilus sp.]|uniref:hypothetical protein n=1 Tax=Xylophilus sp. TaxID=2653893 RepID=UPI0013BD386A|nr:hypothetical protein [Xylophilus sp.]KAF1048745.1 MAG: hypothetical protein GAK38_01189 [Xylophilus sp.]